MPKQIGKAELVDGSATRRKISIDSYLFVLFICISKQRTEETFFEFLLFKCPCTFS